MRVAFVNVFVVTGQVGCVPALITLKSVANVMRHVFAVRVVPAVVSAAIGRA